jgi:type IX secretion system PorP/SprF family membrane protein
LSRRIQWPNLAGSFRTFSASYHQLVRVLQGGLGAYYIYDNAGEGCITESRFNIAYALHFEVKDKLVLRPGITVGYVSRKVDWDKLSFGDQIDPRYGFIYQTTAVKPASGKEYVDLGAGFLAYSKQFYAGVTVDHLNEPDLSAFTPSRDSRLSQKYTFNAGVYLPLGDSANQLSVNPDIVYVSQRDFELAVISGTLKYKILLAGAGFKLENDFILFIGVENKFMRLCYSYDWSTLSNLTAVSHEFYLAVKIYKLRPAKGRWTPHISTAF